METVQCCNRKTKWSKIADLSYDPGSAIKEKLSCSGTIVSDIMLCVKIEMFMFFRKLVANIHHPFSRKTKYVHSFSFCHAINKGKKEILACGHNLQAHLLNHVTYLYYSSWNFLFKSSYFCLLNSNCWIWKWERRSSSMQMKSKSREKMRKLICERRG